MVHLGRVAAQVRGGHVGHRRGDRLGAAVDYLSALCMDKRARARARAHGLRTRAAAEVPGLTVYCTPDTERRGRCGLVLDGGIHPQRHRRGVRPLRVCIRAVTTARSPYERRLGWAPRRARRYHVYKRARRRRPAAGGPSRGPTRLRAVANPSVSIVYGRALPATTSSTTTRTRGTSGSSTRATSSSTTQPALRRRARVHIKGEDGKNRRAALPRAGLRQSHRRRRRSHPRADGMPSRMASALNASW